MMKVEVTAHDPDWRNAFETEAKRITAALDENAIAVHHIGSTAIPDIFAKPIIDILVEVQKLPAVDRCSAAMAALGYEAMGEYGIPGRRYFRKDNERGVRTHHIHVFEADSSEVVRHLAFRDYLIAHPEEAKAYSDLKQRLVKTDPNSMDDYIDGKDDFIRQIDDKAAQWRS